MGSIGAGLGSGLSPIKPKLKGVPLYRSPSFCRSQRYFKPQNGRVKSLKVGLAIRLSTVKMPVLHTFKSFA